MKAGSVVIGKRVGLGAAVMGISEGVQVFFPEYAQAIGSFTVPLIFVLQVIVANRFGVTQ